MAFFGASVFLSALIVGRPPIFSSWSCLVEIGGPMKSKAIELMRQHAVYFIEGPWPEIIQASLPDVMKHGQRYAVAIIPVDE